MTNEEIIEMAKQAGIDMSDRKKYTDYSATCANILLITFARLIERKTREEDAGICKEIVEAYRGTNRGKCAEIVGDHCIERIRSQQ